MYFEKILHVWYNEEGWEGDYRKLFYIHQRVLTMVPKEREVTLAENATLVDLFSRFFEILVAMPMVDWTLYSIDEPGLVLALSDLYHVSPHYGLSNHFIRKEQMRMLD